ncbi:MAG: thioredoxin family protein [Nitrospirae bacterium]|nr:thioredoxin family protein [Nitrospirota bacterium]
MDSLFINAMAAFAAGILLNFTPCVLPVIPIKIQSLLSEIEGTFRSRFLASLALLLGSLAFFMIFGGLIAFMGWKWGELFQSKTFLALLSLFLVLSGLATLSNWSLTLPQFVHKVPIHRYLGAFLTGALAGALSTPCSGPFLGSVLAYAVTKPPAVIIAIFAAIGTGTAFPFATVLLYPGVMTCLPRGGLVGMQIKAIMAFILIAGGIFFSGAFFPKEFYPVLWRMFAFGIAVWCVLHFRRSRKIIESAVPLLAFVGVLAAAAFSFISTESGTLDWRSYSREKVQRSLESGRPVLLEFTADWCINCKVLEKTTYADADVIEAAAKVNLSLFKVDMTEFNDDQKKLLEEYGGTSLPHAVILNSSGGPVHTFSGMFGADYLRKAILAASRGTPSAS